jgi:hypothetical protein
MPSDNLPARTAGTVDISGQLTDLGQALELAETLSRSELVPRALQGHPANVFHVLMTGQALGLHWTESLRVIYSPGPGQVGMRGSFLLSRLRKAGHTYKISEGDESCTFTLTRGDTKEEFSSTFTIDDAIRGGLAKRNDAGDIVALSRDNRPLPWMSWTKRMLRWRAVSDCVGFAAPEVALGFEIEGTEPEPQPEVQLALDAPAPPATGEAAPGDQAAQAAAIAELDQQNRPAEPGMGGNPQMGGNPDNGGEPPGEPEPDASEQREARHDAGEASARRGELMAQLSRQFTDMGWPPAKYRADVLRACSMFAGRRILNVTGLKTAELARLSVQLGALQVKHDPAHQVVALADQVEAWREKFAETDPHGYEAYEQGS